MKLAFLLIFSFSSIQATASSTKIEIVEEVEKRETRRFCSKVSVAEAEKKCVAWLGVQKKNLGSRVLTTYCGDGELNQKVNDCLYRVVGEIKFVLKKYRTETTDK